MKARAQESEIEIELAAQAGSWAGLKASIQAESSQRQAASKWVINLAQAGQAVSHIFALDHHSGNFSANPKSSHCGIRSIRGDSCNALVVWGSGAETPQPDNALDLAKTYGVCNRPSRQEGHD